MQTLIQLLIDIGFAGLVIISVSFWAAVIIRAIEYYKNKKN